MRISILILLISASAWSYPAKNISLSEYEFRRYVRPQLRSMLNEFQSLFFAINDDLSAYKQVFKEFAQLSSLNASLKANCRKDVPKEACVDTLLDFEKHFTNALKVFSSKQSFKKASVEEINFLHKKEELGQELFFLTLKIQNLRFDLNFFDRDDEDFARLSDRIKFLVNKFFSFLLEPASNKVGADFTVFWFDFARPVKEYILENSDRNFFMAHIGNLNVSWNLINVALTKRNYSANKQVNSLLNIMHRRWNNVLKVSLDPKAY